MADGAGGSKRPSSGSTLESAADVVVSVRNVSKKFCRELRPSLRYALGDALRDLLSVRHRGDQLRRGEFWALREVSFDIRRGESVGVMGVNGAGKSTLLKLVLGTLRLTQGETVSCGRVAALTEQGIGFDSLLTGRENVYLAAAVLGIERPRVAACFDQIVAFAELQDSIESPVRYYSSGMRARLGFAIAMYLEPGVLLVDEVLAVGDVGFQRRCIEHVRSYLDAGGSLVLVSHNPLLVQTMCKRCLVLDRGKVVYDGDVVGGVSRYCEIALAAQNTGGHLEPASVDPAGLSLHEEGFPAFGDRNMAGPSTAEKGPVAIEAFGIRAPGEEPLRNSEPATVFLRYRSTREVMARWGFCLVTPDGSVTIACEGRLSPIRLPAGSGELRGTLQQLPLSGGQYGLRVAIMDPDTDLPFAMRGYAEPPQPFTVAMPTSVRNNYRMFAKDLIVLDGLTWEELSDGAGTAPAAAAFEVHCRDD